MQTTAMITLVTAGDRLRAGLEPLTAHKADPDLRW
jgi:hypothetical protein